MRDLGFLAVAGCVLERSAIALYGRFEPWFPRRDIELYRWVTASNQCEHHSGLSMGDLADMVQRRSRK